MLLTFCIGICQGQYVRNSNNSVVAKIESDGTVRNSNSSVIGRFNSNGDIRDSNSHLLGKIGSSGDVRDSNNSYLGKVESDGTGRLAHTTRSAEQIGVRQLSALDGILQGGGQRLLAYDGVERRRAVFSR